MEGQHLALGYGTVSRLGKVETHSLPGGDVAARGQQRECKIAHGPGRWERDQPFPGMKQGTVGSELAQRSCSLPCGSQGSRQVKEPSDAFGRRWVGRKHPPRLRILNQNSSTEAWLGLTLTLAGVDHRPHQGHVIWLEGQGNEALSHSALPAETKLTASLSFTVCHVSLDHALFPC